MRRVIIFSLLALLSLFSLCAARADTDTGSTVINVTIPGTLILNLAYPQIVVPEDYYFYENLTLFQGSSTNTTVYLNKSDINNFVKFVNKSDGATYYQNDYALYVLADTSENVTIRVYVPPAQGYNGGTYNVPIYAYSLNDTRTNITTLEVNVNNTNPIDDISIVGMYPSSLYSGQTLSVNISIHKLYPSETTDIQICYCINANPAYQCGPSYNNYGCEWKAITAWLNYTKTVTVAEGSGSYYFIVAVKYQGDETVKRANSPVFYVQQTPSGPTGGPSGYFAPSAGEPPQPKFVITVRDYFEAFPGDTVAFVVEVKNTGSSGAPNTTLGVYGIDESWVSIAPFIQNIDKGTSKNYSVAVTLPAKAAEQLYHVFLVVKSGQTEKTQMITLIVALSLRDRAKFLVAEAYAKKNDAYATKEKIEEFGIGTAESEKQLSAADVILSSATTLLGSGDYNASIQKSKETIEAYKAAILAMKQIVGNAFYVLLEEVNSGLMKIPPGDEDVVKSIRNKMGESVILQQEERSLEAYEMLLDAKQLLDQLISKIQLQKMYQMLLFVAFAFVLMIIVATAIIYRKKVSRFSKTFRMEEQKKHLKFVFKKEVQPSAPKEKPKEKPPEEAKEVPPQERPVPQLKLRFETEEEKKKKKES
jgi:hypothetical protein